MSPAPQKQGGIPRMQRAAQIDGKLAQRLYIESVRQFFGKGERTAGRIKVLARGKGLKDDEVLYPGQNGQEIIEEQAACANMYAAER